MYIEPNTDIVILRRCPLDTTYNHTIYFNNTTEQYDYFYGLKKYHLRDNSYQRVQKGVMRVQYKADNLYDCNYIMFRNSTFGNKWFYAFITGVEYVNNITSNIKYEIDVMQTWYFDYNLKECFVEREHSITDNIGDNLVPETIETGEYIGGNENTVNYDTGSVEYDHFSGTTVLATPKLSLIIATTFDSNYKQSLGQSYGGVFSGLNFHVFDTTPVGVDKAYTFLQNVGSQADGVFGMFMMPKAFVLDGDVFEPKYSEINGELVITGGNININSPKMYNYNLKPNFDDIDGYKPNNKKLFTYPYNFLMVTNQQGSANVYHYEEFELNQDGECRFVVRGDMSANPCIYMIPLHYKGADTNWSEKTSINSLPQLAFSTDTFKAWYAQNQNAMWTSAISGLISRTANGAIYGGVGGAVAGGISGLAGVVNTVAELIDRQQVPNQVKGATSQNLLASINRFGFTYQKRHIKRQFAMIIDEFFDMYGYATHRVKIPNIGTRPHWNYVKTIGCVAVGSVPSDDMKKICSIYDNGITFWKNGYNIGKYSELDNTV